MMRNLHARLGIALAVSLMLSAYASGGTPGKVTLPKDFKLTSASIQSPDSSSEEFPAGPGAEEMNNNCRACHSPSMVLMQPPLKHEDWVKEVDKMRSTFKAPVQENDIPALLNYLDDMSARFEKAQPASEQVK